jgi:two-component system, cell cycle response regulator DivK
MSTQHVQRVILLAQDHDDSREMYAEFLRHFGYTVVPVADGDTALEHALNADVVVTSIRLRGSLDGATLIQRLRDNDRTKDTPIIVLAAEVFPQSRVAVEAAGCDAFLPMPCVPDELLREIRRMVLRRVHGGPAKADDSGRLNVGARERRRKG